MTTTEELLVDYLSEQAREATVEFTLEDVEQGTLPVSLVDRPRRPDRRAGLMGIAVAAGIALIVGTVILRAAPDSPSPLATETSTETEPAVEPDNAPDTGAEPSGTQPEPSAIEPVGVISIDPGLSPLDDSVGWFHIRSAAHLAGRSVGVGQVAESDQSKAAVWWSDDGLTWTRVDDGGDLFGPNTPTSTAPIELLDVIATADGFVAVGGNEEFVEGQQPLVWLSDDGITWTRIPPDPDIGAAYLRAIASFDGGLAAVGLELAEGVSPGAVWRSVDGIDWELAFRPPDQFFDLASVSTASGSVLFAITDRAVYYSSDAISWVRAEATISPEIETLPGIGIIVEDSEGRPIASSDGVTWTRLALGHAAGERISVRGAAGSAELMLIHGTTYLPVSDPSACSSRKDTGTWLWASTDGGDSWQQLQLDPAPPSGLGVMLDIGDQILSVTSAPSLIDEAQITLALADINTGAGTDTEPDTTAEQDATATASSSCP